MGRFRRYCPDCATSISSLVATLKLLFSITCITMGILKKFILAAIVKGYGLILFLQCKYCLAIIILSKTDYPFEDCVVTIALVSLLSFFFSFFFFQFFRVSFGCCIWGGHIRGKKMNKVSSQRTWNKYLRKFCSSTSISSGESFCCSNFWLPCTGSKREYSCCKDKTC